MVSGGEVARERAAVRTRWGEDKYGGKMVEQV